GRNEIDVDRPFARGRGKSPTVHEHAVTRDAEPSQIDDACADIEAAETLCLGPGAVPERWQLGNRLCDVGDAAAGQVVAAQRGHRRRAVEGGATQPRAGDDDRSAALVARAGRRGRGLFLRLRRNGCEAVQGAGGEQIWTDRVGEAAPHGLSPYSRRL